MNLKHREYRIMINRMNKQRAFHPSVTEARLEERMALSSIGNVLTPPPAPPPFYSPILIRNPVD
jgi:hypothetical protein